jgi:hypothetical protein
MSEDPRKEPFPCTIEEQLAYFMRLAASRPSENDPMGMVQFGATLVSMRLVAKMLQAEQEKEQQS